MYPSRYIGACILAFISGVAAASFISFPWMISSSLLLLGLSLLLFLPKRFLLLSIVLLGFAFGLYDIEHQQGAWIHSPKFILQKAVLVRDTFVKGLERAVPEPESTFLAGILVGTRSKLSADTVLDFRRTGTSHIVAISGYNVTIIANVLGWLCIWVFPRRFVFLAVVIGLLFFMILTGAQASVIRATLMGISVILARHVGRLPTPFYTLLLTAGVMIALEPRILRYDIGFQLSFFATVGILVVAPMLQSRLRWLERFGNIGELFAMTVAAQLCVLPLLLYYFKTLSLTALPVNLIILPLIPITMLFGFAGGVLGYVPILGRLFGFIPWALSSLILNVIHLFSKQTLSIIFFPISFSTMIILYAFGGIFFWHIYRDGIKKGLFI